ncbi:MAG: hypothetical protein JSR46_03575 [Verrucomicrobia bacterium]|nr:hypothetical protein [Verrucomicrobiota bacterium]
MHARQTQQTKDFLIRNMPIALFEQLEQSAREHRRSNTQEAIVAIEQGLSVRPAPLKRPQRLEFSKKISKKFVLDAIVEGRE